MSAADAHQPTVVITGGAGGWGPALARRFEQDGFHAVLAELDGRDPARSRALVERVVAERGAIDVWVNGATVEHGGPSETLASAAWDNNLSTVLTVAFYGAQAAGAHMLARGRGVIVNVGTVEAYQAREGHAADSAAQAGLVALTRALGVEWAGRGVRVVGVAAGLPLDEAVSERRIPLRRAGMPEEIAEAVFFVASDEAAFMVGETLRVDGGWTAYHLF